MHCNAFPKMNSHRNMEILSIRLKTQHNQSKIKTPVATTIEIKPALEIIISIVVKNALRR